jgi:hypothetical protein
MDTGVGTDMMAIRQAALDALGGAGASGHAPFLDIEVDLRHHAVPRDPAAGVAAELADAVANRLHRGSAHTGPGAAVIVGLTDTFGDDLVRARAFHESLFRAVWEVFRGLAGQTGSATDYRVKTGTIADGEIPLELYGSSWSFKQLHIDREVLLFSHLYGPVSGFSGGVLQLVDIVPFMVRRSLRFADVFEWSDEPTTGSKPVLREAYRSTAFGECGIDIGPLGPDLIVFVNNMPDAGVLHGVTPVVVTDPERFRREYHRCSVKDLRLC